MGATRRKFSQEFKLEPVHQLEAGRRLAEVARELGGHATVLRRWKDQVAVDAQNAFPGNEQASRRRRWHRYWSNHPAAKILVVVGAAGVMGGMLAYLFRAPLLTGAAEFLIVNDSARAADIIVVLNGDFAKRSLRAGQLFHEGLAPQIVIARNEDRFLPELNVPNTTDLALRILTSLGVPREQITLLTDDGGGATSTYDEALRLREYIEAGHVRRVIVVTSAFHTRRAKWIFGRILRDVPLELQIIAAPHRRFDATNWWRTE